MASSSSPATSPIPVQVEHQPQDRLGALPDSILLQILSCLATIDAVRTSVLSTRWRTLWTSVGVLDLDEEYNRDFFFSGTGKRTIRGTKRKSNSNFAEFVVNVLSLHRTPTLHKFRLSYCSRSFPLKDWVIRTALSRRVPTLHLRLPRHSDVRGGSWLPPLLFTSQSLVDLRLDLDGSALILPETMALVRLRRMRLCRVKFCDDHSTGALFSSSTALRIVALENCNYEKLGCLEITSSSLRVLAIEDSSPLEDGLGSCQVKIAAPLLRSFVYRASVAQAYVVEPLFCVEYVKIQLKRFQDKQFILDRASSFLCSLSSARNLDICPACVQVLRYKGVPFNNLNVLRAAVEHLDCSVIHVVLRLLLANPQLRALTVEVGKFSVLPSSDAGKEDFLELLGACFESGINGVLERVEITCRHDSTFATSRNAVRYTTETVLELVKVLLGSQARLNKLILTNCLFCGSSNPDRRRDAVMEKVMSFPKRSTELLAVAFI